MNKYILIIYNKGYNDYSKYKYTIQSTQTTNTI